MLLHMDLCEKRGSTFVLLGQQCDVSDSATSGAHAPADLMLVPQAASSIAQ